MNPDREITGGYDIHVYFTDQQLELGKIVFLDFLTYLKVKNIDPTYKALYSRGPTYEGGPHRKMPSFDVHLEGRNPSRDSMVTNIIPLDRQLGLAVSWLMLNRKGLKVMIHPNTAKPFGDIDKEIIDHKSHSIWMGLDLPDCIDLSFFDEIKRLEASVVEDMARARNQAEK